MGGGQFSGSAIAAGLVETLVLHLSPIDLGSCTPLFLSGPPRQLIQHSVVATSTASHLTYDVG